MALPYKPPFSILLPSLAKFTSFARHPTPVHISLQVVQIDRPQDYVVQIQRVFSTRVSVVRSSCLENATIKVVCFLISYLSASEALRVSKYIVVSYIQCISPANEYQTWFIASAIKNGRCLLPLSPTRNHGRITPISSSSPQQLCAKINFRLYLK